MPEIKNDKRDPVMGKIGSELKKLKESDPEKLTALLGTLSPEEAKEILYNQDVWLRDNQWVDLSHPATTHLLLCGRG